MTNVFIVQEDSEWKHDDVCGIYSSYLKAMDTYPTDDWAINVDPDGNIWWDSAKLGLLIEGFEVDKSSTTTTDGSCKHV